MASRRERSASIFDVASRRGLLACLAVIVLASTITAAPEAQAQTFQVIHSFTGGADGSNPNGGVTLDQGGNLYGTTTFGAVKGNACGEYGCGIVFRMKRYGSVFAFNPIYTFTGPDGAFPLSRVVFGPDGMLYGTTAGGGG